MTETRIIYRSKCPCDIHYSKLLIEHRYNISADTLFDLIFGSNDFVRTYRLAQRLFGKNYQNPLTSFSKNYFYFRYERNRMDT